MTSAAAPSCSLPAFVEPMLCASGEAFDSGDHLFELKWDGTRGLAFVDDAGKARIVNRRRIDITDRYPELAAALAALPPGTLLDGEVVVLGPDGKPDFGALQSREHTRAGRRRVTAAASHPATYIAFDQLYRDYRPTLKEPLHSRREILGATLAGASPRIVMSQGVVGDGRAYFDQACKQGLEGMVAKRLNSPYLPGKRTDAWVKVKRCEVLCCVVIGFTPDEDGRRDFAALIIATQTADGLVACVGKVGSGFDQAVRDRINSYLWSHLRKTPVIPAPIKNGIWVEPGLFCQVRCMERTTTGQLRAPAFLGIIGGGDG